MRLLLVLCTALISLGIHAQKFTLPELRFAYDAYEQGVDAQTMEIHHSKHHKGYVRKLNNAVSDSKLENKSLEELLMRASLRSSAVRNNAGGHYNHTLFWEILTPTINNVGPEPMRRSLEKAINEQFSSIEGLRKELSSAAAKRFGSGWAWLVVTPEKKLVVSSSPNQDNPIMDVSEVRGIPILAIDVWEHAYYLRYQNKRGDYLSAIWSLLDWGVVSSKYTAALNDPLLVQIEKEHWPEKSSFHQTLSELYNASVKGDFLPTRDLSGTLFSKSILLQDSNIPLSLMSPEVLSTLIRLEKKCGSLNKQTSKNAKDKSLLKTIGVIHDIFHELQDFCYH